MEIGITTEQLFVSLISYVVVDEKDPAFQNPTKPIGPSTPRSRQGACLHHGPYGQGLPPRGGKPQPLAIVEHREIKK